MHFFSTCTFASSSMVYQQTLSASISRADPELEVHSVDEYKPSLKYGMPEQLKAAAPENGVTSTSTKRTNESSKSTTSGRNETTLSAAHEKTSRCNDYGYDVTDSEDCGDSKVDLGYHFTWSDEDEPSFLDQQGFGINVYESIRAISKEASKKIDAVLAVDHVDQLQEELRKLRSEMKRRHDEFSDLKGVVHMKDHQIGTLELERDLYKADTAKLANDLETCLFKLRRLGGATSPIQVSSNDVEKETKYDEPNIVSPSNQQEPKGLNNESNSNDRDCSVTMVPPLQPKYHDIQNVTVQTALSFSQATGADTASTASNVSLSTNQISTPPRNAAVVPETRTDQEQPAPFPNLGTTNLASSITNDVTSPNQRRKKVLLFGLCRGSKAKKKIYNTKKTQSVGASVSAFHPQINGNHATVPKDKHVISPEILHRPHGILHSQIEDMDQRLHSFMKTSEDSRRRIAMLHLYYESQGNCFDSSLVGNPEMQFDLAGQSSIHQPRFSTTSEIESKPHQANQDIQSLRKLRVVTFNI
jgi:hypothetical protein